MRVGATEDAKMSGDSRKPRKAKLFEVAKCVAIFQNGLTNQTVKNGFLASLGLAGKKTFLESLILAQDERWRRA